MTVKILFKRYGCIVPTYVQLPVFPTINSNTKCNTPNSGYNLANSNIPNLIGTFYCCNSNICNTAQLIESNANLQIILIFLISTILGFT